MKKSYTCKGGEKLIFIEQIYKEYYHDIYLFLLALTKNESLAEEITQETFFKAMKSLNSYEGKCDIKVWLCQIAKNTYFTYCKKQKRMVPQETEVKIEHQDCSFVEQIVEAEQSLMIHKILHQMEEPYKEVFHLRVFGELSFKQIGDIYGKTESWARVTYHRAKLKIVEELED